MIVANETQREVCFMVTLHVDIPSGFVFCILLILYFGRIAV